MLWWKANQDTMLLLEAGCTNRERKEDADTWSLAAGPFLAWDVILELALGTWWENVALGQSCGLAWIMTVYWEWLKHHSNYECR